MNVTTLCEEIALIAEAGDTADVLDLVRTLNREGRTARAIETRRTVSGGQLDRTALRALGERIGREHAQAEARAAQIFTPEVIDSLYAMEAALSEDRRQQAAMSPAERRARSEAEWTTRQRHAEAVTRYNAAVDRVNRARGAAANKRQAAAVRAQTCGSCFQVPAANGVCGC